MILSFSLYMGLSDRETCRAALLGLLKNKLCGILNKSMWLAQKGKPVIGEDMITVIGGNYETYLEKGTGTGSDFMRIC